jgi:hypothetical protein
VTENESTLSPSTPKASKTYWFLYNTNIGNEDREPFNWFEIIMY